VPVYHDRQLWSWTARGISNQEIRFLSAGKGITDNKINDFLFDSDQLTGGDKLMITEGPLDAVKVSNAIIPKVSATSLFGKVLQPAQMKRLLEVAPLYKEVVIALDQDALKDSLAMKEKLSWYLDKISILIPSEKDWGMMPLQKIKDQVLGK
jgi:5S rRNA maturation endonuclease (ribonuclease M5)